MKWIAVILQALRAACEWSEGHAKGRLKDEIGLQDIYEVRKERVYKTAYLPEAIIQSWLKPDATRRRAKHGQRLDFKLLYKGRTTSA